MLARPGWNGSSYNSGDWWKQAVFYNVASPQPADFKAISARLDALRALSIDAIILPAPALPPPGSNGSMPDLDDFTALLRQASAHGIRVLLTIDAPSADLAGVARFWLSRGVAGLHIATPPETSPEQTQSIVQAVRKLTSGVAGSRIVISDLDLAPPDQAESTQTARHAERHATAGRSSAAQLQIDTRLDRLATLDAATLRPLLAQTIAEPDLLLDLHPTSSPPASPDTHAPLDDAIAAITLITHPAALIDSRSGLVLEPALPHAEAPAEEPAKPNPPARPAPPPGTYLPYVPYVAPPKPHVVTAPKPAPVDPLTAWYMQLAALHHDSGTLRSASKIFLDFDAQNALVWVNRPAASSTFTPPVIVVCNLSSAPVQLALGDAIKSLNLHGTFLRTLLRSYQAIGPQDLNAVQVPPFGVYIGELRR